MDPWGLDPLSVRVCEMAGDARGRLPGVVLVGVAPKPANPGAKVSIQDGKWIGERGDASDVDRILQLRTRAAGLFQQSEACSSTGSITVASSWLGGCGSPFHESMALGIAVKASYSPKILGSACRSSWPSS